MDIRLDPDRLHSDRKRGICPMIQRVTMLPIGSSLPENKPKRQQAARIRKAPGIPFKEHFKEAMVKVKNG